MLAAEAEYRAAQLKAKQAIERTEEEAHLAMQKSQIARREAERELEVASVKLSVWKESAVSNLPPSQHLLPKQHLPPSQHLSPKQHLPSSQHLPPIQHLPPNQHLPPLEFDPTFLMTSTCKAEQSRTLLKIVTAGEHVSNICVSTICNSVNNVKPSVASSTFAVKPVTNSVKFNDIINARNVAEPLCSNCYSSNKSKNEPVYSN